MVFTLKLDKNLPFEIIKKHDHNIKIYTLK